MSVEVHQQGSEETMTYSRISEINKLKSEARLVALLPLL
jgi:hypothetical protein